MRRNGRNGTKIMAEGCRTFENMAEIYGSSTSVPIAVSNGNTIKVSIKCTKTRPFRNLSICDFYASDAP